MSRLTFVRRFTAAALAALIVGVTFVPVDSEARPRGGAGSRGSKTYSAPPPTATSPGAAPIQRSQTPNAGQTQPGAAAGAAGQAGRPGGMFGGMFGGGFGGMLMGGLLGAGLFGLLSGSGLFGGLGSLASILGLVIQLAIVFFVVRFAIGWWRRRQQGAATPAYQGANNAPRDAGPYRLDGAQQQSAQRSSGFGSGFGFGGGSAAASAAKPLSLDAGDFDVFERLLGDVQAAWSAQDEPKLRSIATPEIADAMAEDLAADAQRGVVNRTGSVKLLQGDLSEAWSEGERDYATVAMRYELTDATYDKSDGRVVDGDPEKPVEAVELWTFVRVRGADWRLSAIQDGA